jgi:hypothetical protein
MTAGTGVSFEVKLNIQAVTDWQERAAFTPFFRFRVASAACGGGRNAETEAGLTAARSGLSVSA